MKNKTHVVIIQPPIVQLNTPYPSGAYLKAFFQKISELNTGLNIGSIKWIDSGNILFNHVFSKEGLAHIFSVTQHKALKQALQAENEGNDNIAFNLRRYIAQKESWIKWIPAIKDILTGKTQELYHEFVRSPSVPRGQRMENFLVQLERDAGVDDVRILASLALADLADYISAVFDSSYSLVRYAESLATSTKDFSVVEKTINSPILHDFYVYIVNDMISELPQNDKILVCISCPFPGTLAGALCTGKIFKEKLGNKCFVVMGGGYVNTELRSTNDIRLNNYIDALSFDRGYGSYLNLFDLLNDNTDDFSLMKKCDKSIYKMRLFLAEKVLDAHHEKCEYSSQEDKITPEIVPDYSGIDFTKYPRLA
ncbi:MAG: radical SAM protein, partial [Spirochaetaceae bacterium]|nr:radical SAM protein [Spirochaetaceae bacterium]